MKKRIIILITVLTWLIPFENVLIAQEINLPNLTPSSPEASAITKYGDVSLNENSGFVVQNIPLYEYQSGQLKLPISVTYQGAGVRVDDSPTWVGMNWILNAGGVITRIVKDIPDENAVNRILLTNEDVQYYYENTYDGTPDGQYMKTLANHEQYDTEVDIFQFNFGAYSGSFFLDENKIPRILNNKHQLKIELNSNFYVHHTIKITTPDGLIYNFGGDQAIEQTTRRYVINNNVSPQDTNDGVTALYLTSIQHPLHGTINFEYHQNLGTKILVTQKIEKASREYERVPLNSCNYINSNGSSTTVSTRVLNPKYLSRIYSANSDYEIIFNSDAVESDSYSRVLRKIIIRKTSSLNIIKSIDFEYFDQNSAGRIFLKKIVFNAELTNSSDDFYRFEYNDPSSLPNRFSKSQDYAGYFNNINNTTLIPNNLILNPTNIPGIYADRNPVFYYASKGTLTHVHYPTKGYTFYEYEGTKAKKRRIKQISLWAYRNIQDYIPINKLTAGIPMINEDGSVYGIQNVFENQSVKIKVILKATDANTSITPQQEKATLTITDLTSNTTPKVHQLSMPSPDGYQGVQTILKEFNLTHSLIQGHNYKIEIQIYANSESPNPTPMEANVFIEFCDGVDLVDNLGVRIKRTTNYSKDNNPESIKRVYYKTTLSQIQSVENNIPYIDNILPVKTEPWFLNGSCGGTTQTMFVEAFTYGVYVFSDKFDHSNVSNVGNFETVSVSYGGDNYEQGGVEKTFRKNESFGSLKIPTKHHPGVQPCSAGYTYDLDVFNSFEAQNPLNGELLKEIYMTNVNSAIKKQKQVEYQYTIGGIKRINNLISRKKFNVFYIDYPNTYDNIASIYEIGVYITESNRNELSKKTEIDYIDLVPLNELDESNYKKIVNETQYTYQSELIGMPSEIKTYKSDGYEKKIKNYYVTNYNLNNLNDIPVNYLSKYHVLKDNHIFSEPFQVETYENSQLISKKRVLYKSWLNNANAVMPEIIQFSKGANTLEDRILFHDYSLWNPSVVSYKNGAKTKYLYNQNNQVIVKVENYTPEGVGEIDENNTQNFSPCSNINYDVNVTTLYYYNSITHLLEQIKNPNCTSVFYIYDELHRLKQIKDNENNIVKEFDYNYRRN